MTSDQGSKLQKSSSRSKFQKLISASPPSQQHTHTTKIKSYTKRNASNKRTIPLSSSASQRVLPKAATLKMFMPTINEQIQKLADTLPKSPVKEQAARVQV